MSLRRLRWLLLPLAGATALAVLVLPPRSLPEDFGLVGTFLGFGGRSWRPEMQAEHRWSIQRARDQLRAGIVARSHGLTDVLASRTSRATRSPGGSVVVVRDDDVPDSTARVWLRVVERELARVPPASAVGAPVIVALHTTGPVELGSWTSSETVRDQFQFEDRGTRACIVDIVFPRRAERRWGRFDVPPGMSGNVLGRCALYARFGPPGPEVRGWAGLESSWTRRWSWWYGDEPMFAARHAAPEILRFRSEYGGVPWAELACLREVDAYCAALAGLGSGVAIGRARDFYYYGWGYVVSTDRFLADVIVHRGPDRFVTFWTSSLRPDSALQVAYGVPAGALAREAIGRRLVAEPLAQPTLAGLLVAAGWVIALGALATALAWRREMDL